MKRCPKCERFGVECDPCSSTERCLWIDCGWINKENIDLDAVKFKLKFKKFIKSIKRKKGIAL